MKLKVLNRTTPFRGRVFNVVVDDVEYPSGNKSVREVAEHSGGAVILAHFPDDTILLVNQHRYPFDAFIWELPAGKLNPGEDPLHCAQRELEEETGYLGADWKKLTAIYTTPGFCSEVLHIYLATGLSEAPWRSEARGRGTHHDDEADAIGRGDRHGGAQRDRRR